MVDMASWLLPAVLAAFFAALVAVLGKVGLESVDATAATALRAVVMAVLLVAVAAALGKTDGIGAIGWRALAFIAASGVAGALSWLCFFVALSRGPAVGVSAIDRLSVVFVAILAVAFLGEESHAPLRSEWR